MNLFRNIAINLHAAGPAAAVIIWMLCVTVVGVFGVGEIAHRAMTYLGGAGVILLLFLLAPPGERLKTASSNHPAEHD
jgi:hypothetical protein